MTMLLHDISCESMQALLRTRYQFDIHASCRQFRGKCGSDPCRGPSNKGCLSLIQEHEKTLFPLLPQRATLLLKKERCFQLFNACASVFDETAVGRSDVLPSR